jgi:peptide/nickel transport system substrate-binding protein
MVAAACGGSSDNNADKKTSGTDAPKTSANAPHQGGEMTYEAVGEVRSMDPTVAGGSALSGEPVRLLAVYGGLMIVDNKTSALEMSMSTAITSDDKAVWTMKLRPKVTFTDGTAYDAEAVKFNWERQASIAAAPSNPLAKTIKSIEVVDPLTLKITLNLANAVFPRNISASSLNYVGSPTAIKASGADYGAKPVGAGPFVIKEWVRDSQMVLERNTKYWDAPKPYLDRVIVKVISEESQRLNSLNAGEGDATIMSQPTVQKQAKDAGLDVATVNGISFFGVTFNQQRPPFDDVKVRKALVQALDPVQMNEVATEGLGEVADHWFSKASPFYEANLPYPKYDPTAAQAAIDKYFADTGKEIDFKVNWFSTPQTTAVNDYMTGVFSKMKHVKFTGSFVALGQLTSDLLSRNFVGSFTGFFGADPEPNMAEQFLSNGTRNRAGVNVPELDKAILAARNTNDVAARKKYYATAQKLLNENVPFIMFPRTYAAIVHTAKVMDLPLFEDGGARLDLAWVKG